MNSVKELNFQKTTDSQIQLWSQIWKLLQHWFSKICETFYWTNSVNFLKEALHQSKPDTENASASECLVSIQDAHFEEK